MRVAAEAKGVSERQQYAYGVAMIRVAQENLSLKETEHIISETEEESWEKNMNQRPLEENSRIEGMSRKLN